MPRHEREDERHGKQAEAFYTRALGIREKALKPDDPAIADSLLNLGQLETIRGRPAECEKYFERLLAMEVKRRAPANERQAKALFMLAGSAMDRKDLVESDLRLARTQEVWEKVYGVESEEVSMLLSMRAMIAIDATHFDGAERFLKRGLEIQVLCLGPDDPYVKAARSLMAGRYQDHINDGRVHLLWHRVEALGKQAERERHHKVLG